MARRVFRWIASMALLEFSFVYCSAVDAWNLQFLCAGTGEKYRLFAELWSGLPFPAVAARAYICHSRACSVFDANGSKLGAWRSVFRATTV